MRITITASIGGELYAAKIMWSLVLCHGVSDLLAFTVSFKVYSKILLTLAVLDEYYFFTKSKV